MIIVLNNKCNLLMDEFIKYQESLSKLESKHELVLCPSNIYLSKFSLDNFKLGSQNVGSNHEGAFTGETSAKQLKALNVEYAIVGHSERRKHQNEANEEINKKIKMLLDNGITPILCVGENIDERESNMTIVKILDEIKEAFKDIDDASRIIIAYEPIWAIGTGNTPEREEIDNVLKKIKESYPKNLLLYGGSLSVSNIENINKSTYIDGYLLGGLSLKVEELKKFLEIIG